MKYRMLNEEELSHFSEEFKHFLIVNGGHAQEWEKLNRDEPNKAYAIVELFSDTVLQRIYEKIRYLEFRSKDSCMLFYFPQDRIYVISIQSKPNPDVNLSTPEDIHYMLTNHAELLSFFQTSKAYNSPREDEIHRFLEQGCVLSSKEFWDKIQEVVND
jgi:hypothetical protein